MLNGFDREVRKRVQSVKRRRIIQRIIALVRHFKAEKTEDGAVKGNVTLNVAGGGALFFYESYGDHNENLVVQVLYGGVMMFEAVSGPRGFEPSTDPRLIFREGGSAEVVVRTYRPGIWMEPLDLKRLRRREEKAEREREARETMALAELERPVPVREMNSRIAQRFGLTEPGMER